VHYTYTIRITEVGNGSGRSKTCGTSFVNEEEEEEKKIMAKTLGINVKELLSYTCSPEL
jgi:hypothetical protein